MEGRTTNVGVETALEDAKKRFASTHPHSHALFQSALSHLPVGSTRTGIFVEPFPVILERDDGAKLWDVDGHCLVDFVAEATAGLYGHSNPVLRKTIEDRLAQGWSLGGHTELEQRLAAKIAARF